jgi:hypothetical protein
MKLSPISPSEIGPSGTKQGGWVKRPNLLQSPQMHLTAGNPLLPIASLVAGVFLIVAPQIVSFAVAVYLIFVGLLRLNGIYHIVH